MAWVRMTGGNAKKDTNLLKGTWSVTISTNDVTTTNVLTDTLASMTIKSASTSSNRVNYAYINSPIFNVTDMSALVLRGSTYKTAANTNVAYCPAVYLINASTQEKTEIYVQQNTGQNTGGTIMLSYDVSSLSGNYYFQGVIMSYGNSASVQPAGAYIKFIGATLQK